MSMNNLLELPHIASTRRNHALEHATIHILSRRFPGRAMAGYSIPGGFFLLGNLPTEQVGEAVVEALTRLQHGEHTLAIHDGCGTNYAVIGWLAAMFAFLGFAGTKNDHERMERLPVVMVLSILAFIWGRSLGPALQKSVTTQANPGGLVVREVYRISDNLHRVVTKNLA